MILNLKIFSLFAKTSVVAFHKLIINTSQIVCFISLERHVYYSAVKREFLLSKMTPNMLSSPMKFYNKTGCFPIQNNPKTVDLSYKMDLDIWDCFERKNNPSYSRINMESPL